MSRPPRPLYSLALALVLAATLAGCGSDDAATTTTTAPPAEATTTPIAPSADTTTTLPEEASPDVEAAPPVDYAGFREQPPACDGEVPPENPGLQFSAPDEMDIDRGTRPTATLVTSCGEIIIELDPSIAPETVNSFVFLATAGYFDGTAAHRIVPGFVFQAGDPTATGSGNPGYVVPDEFPESSFRYEHGVVAMANAGPGTTGSQFFIMLDDIPDLPPRFSVFGKVVDGSEVLDTISQVPIGTRPDGEPSVPLETVYIERVMVED